MVSSVVHRRARATFYEMMECACPLLYVELHAASTKEGTRVFSNALHALSSPADKIYIKTHFSHVELRGGLLFDKQNYIHLCAREEIRRARARRCKPSQGAFKVALVIAPSLPQKSARR
jgi:hypothetical protein